MFDKNFFPTPEHIIAKLIEGIDFRSGFKVLEPSAGKGNILDYIIQHYKSYYYTEQALKKHLYCIEKNEDLQSILRNKGYNLIDTDFLKHKSDFFYDYIIMNPPFDNGVKHLLKAWEISKGAEIRCLLNAETINNPYSKERQLLLEIINQNDGEIINLGDCFSDAERKTNVDVVLIKLKDSNYKSEFEFNIKNSGQEKSFNFEDIQQNQLAKINMFERLEDQYTKVNETFAKYLSIKNELNHYAKDLINEIHGIDSIIDKSKNDNYNLFYNNFVENLRKSSWKNIFDKTKLNNIITKKAREDFCKFQEQQGYMQFTVENMENLFYTLMANQGNIMEKCIEDAFDLMTKYHKENREYIEGWKTNDSWKVNKRFILPRMMDDWIHDCRLGWRSKEDIADIEKAMCFISGKKYQNINSIEKLFNENDMEFGKKYTTEFFEIKAYKKGTMHFRFLDDYIYTQFNLKACQSKNWLPKVS